MPLELGRLYLFEPPRKVKVGRLVHVFPADTVLSPETIEKYYYLDEEVDYRVRVRAREGRLESEPLRKFRRKTRKDLEVHYSYRGENRYVLQVESEKLGRPYYLVLPERSLRLLRVREATSENLMETVR